MLYWLSAFSDTIGPLNVLRYITFRTGGAMITALVFVFLFGPWIIDHLRLLQGKGRLMHRTATLAFTEATIVDAQGRACAHATGTFKYVKRRLPTGPASANEMRPPSTD